MPITCTPCNIKNKKEPNTKPCNVICKIDSAKLDYIQQNRKQTKGKKLERETKRNPKDRMHERA